MGVSALMPKEVSFGRSLFRKSEKALLKHSKFEMPKADIKAM
jgi:hypothetical protein